MRNTFRTLAIAVSVSLPAQEIPRASIVDKDLGWMRVYDFKEGVKPQKVDHRVYSPAQLAIAADLARWMQASYSPIGGLGDITIAVSEKLGAYNQNTAAAAQSYGVFGRIYTEL